jgi:hypothetical protein
MEASEAREGKDFLCLEPLIIGMHVMVNLLIEPIAMRRLGNTGDTLSFVFP